MSELSLVSQKVPHEAGGLVSVEQQRAIQEVQAAMVIAKRFPRDVDESYTRIMKACERKTLADSAMYAYPRGGQTVTGPSIRLAETIAQNWGNLQFGIRELNQSGGHSEVEAFAWDVETNTRQVKVFKVPHKRYSKKKGLQSLTDPRDIYEMVANQGARRLRACILGVIPGDIVDAAIAQCEKTLSTQGGTPIEDRIRKMLTQFEKFGISKQMIETRLNHKTDAIIEQELVDLIKIFTSLRDGMSTREDWFEIKPATSAAPEVALPAERDTSLYTGDEPTGTGITDDTEAIQKTINENDIERIVEPIAWGSDHPWWPTRWERMKAGNGKDTGFIVFFESNLDTIMEVPENHQRVIFEKFKRVYPDMAFPISFEWMEKIKENSAGDELEGLRETALELKFANNTKWSAICKSMERKEEISTTEISEMSAAELKHVIREYSVPNDQF